MSLGELILALSSNKLIMKVLNISINKLAVLMAAAYASQSQSFKFLLVQVNAPVHIVDFLGFMAKHDPLGGGAYEFVRQAFINHIFAT